MSKTSVVSRGTAESVLKQFVELLYRTKVNEHEIEWLLEVSIEEAEEWAVCALNTLKAGLGDIHYLLYGESVRIRETNKTAFSEWGKASWDEFLNILKSVIRILEHTIDKIGYHIYGEGKDKEAIRGAKAGYSRLSEIALTLHNVATGEEAEGLIYKT